MPTLFEQLQTPAKPEGAATVRNAQQEPIAMPPEPEEHNAAPSDAGVAEMCLATFIRQQRSQLEMLKSRLDKLKEIYNDAAGQLISTRMREKLEQPVVETMKSYDSMQESLKQLIQSVESAPR